MEGQEVSVGRKGLPHINATDGHAYADTDKHMAPPILPPPSLPPYLLWPALLVVLLPIRYRLGCDGGPSLLTVVKGRGRGRGTCEEDEERGDENRFSIS